MKKSKLEKELKLVGAGTSEAEKLADIAELVNLAKPRGLSAETKKRLAPNAEAAKPRRKVQTWQWGLAGSFASACMLLIVAQSALPGSWLYNLKRKTEEARALLQPGYRDTIVENREEEVQQLLLEKADPAVLEEAEEEFKQSVEKSVDRWKEQEPKKEEDKPAERFTPRYDWSRKWYNSRDFTQRLKDSLQRPEQSDGDWDNLFR